MEPSNEHETATPSTADLISGLHDDLLLRILSFLPAAREVARTPVLSRRWRHLWSNAIALRFTVGSEPKEYRYTQADRDEAIALIATANAVLTRRALASLDVEDLELSFIYSSKDNTYKHYHAADIRSEHVTGWISFAARHVTGKLTLKVPLVPRKFHFGYAVAAPMNAVEEDQAEEVEGEGEEGGFAVPEVVEEEAPMPEEEYLEEDLVEGGEEAGLAVNVVEQVAPEAPQPEEDEDYQDQDYPLPPEYEYEAVEEQPLAQEDEDDDEEYPFTPEYEYEDENEASRALFAELPCSARVKEMSLTLGKAILTVPNAGAGAFHALTDILLSHIIFYVNSGDDLRLGHLLSSSCSPVLRRVQLNYIEGLRDLRLNAAGTLQELQVHYIRHLDSLDVSATGLHVLGVEECFELNSIRISAPRLEVLACQQTGCVHRLRFDGATTSLRRIQNLQLSLFHPRNEKEDDDNSAAMWFLCHCNAVDRLGLEVMGPPERKDGEEPDYEDNITHIPKLPNVSNLKMEFSYGWSEHAIGATAAKLIAKCTEIEDLSITTSLLVNFEDCLDPNCICSGTTGWENQKLSLEHLRNIEFCNFKPLESLIQLVQLLLTSAPALEKMTLALQPFIFEGSVAKHFHIPCYGGSWIPCDWKNNSVLGIKWATMYEWSRISSEGEVVEKADLDGIGVCVP